MKTSSLFTPTAAEIDNLVATYPFAQLVSAHANELTCTPLPLLLRHDQDGDWLVGHFARSNPHVSMLRQQGRAIAIFMGPHGYVSPSWMRDRSQAPTWNYATIHFDVEVTFDESEDAGHTALGLLVEHLEKDRPTAWAIRDLGDRYTRLSKAIIAFRAHIMSTKAKFKLGQNERRDVFDDIVHGLCETGATDLANMMMAFDRRGA